MSDRVEVTVEKHIAVVRLNRPDKHNALDHAAFEELIEAGETLAGNPSIRAVILAGAGDSFCAGIDRSILQDEAPAPGNERMAPRAGGPANFYQSAAIVWREIPVPVIAAVHGVAFGAGLQIALAADIRIASPSARFSIMEIQWGIIPDMGITVSARNVLALDRLKMLSYTGMTVEGAAALRLGLVTELNEDPLAAARQVAGQIAGRSPDAIRALKSLLNDSLHAPVATALANEARFQRSLFGSVNQREAVMATLDKREPRFRDPDARPAAGDHDAE